MDNNQTPLSKTNNFTVVNLNYISIYVKDYEAAIAFYSQVFGDPQIPEGNLKGWPMGSTWLTLFPSTEGTCPDRNPCNAEFAIQVATPDQVDNLYHALLNAGAKVGWAPEDTEMYEPMRFCYVDDPFGMRLDIYCPL